MQDVILAPLGMPPSRTSSNDPHEVDLLTADRRAVVAACKSGQEAQARRRHATPPHSVDLRRPKQYFQPLTIPSLHAGRSANCGSVCPALSPSALRARSNCSTGRPRPCLRPHRARSSYRHLLRPVRWCSSMGIRPCDLCRHQRTQRYLHVPTPPTEWQERCEHSKRDRAWERDKI